LVGSSLALYRTCIKLENMIRCINLVLLIF
jgi:hypothetical protein